MSSSDRTILEKDAELEVMRKKKSEQRDYFKQLEEGKISNEEYQSKPKLMVGKIKDKKETEEDFNEDVPEMASVSSRFSFFENHQEKQEETERKRSRKTPPRLSKSHIVSFQTYQSPYYPLVLKNNMSSDFLFDISLT